MSKMIRPSGPVSNQSDSGPPGRLHLHPAGFYKDAGQLKIWGINPVDKNADELWQFLIRREVTYSSLLDPQKTVASTLGINAYPTVILVDARSREVLYVQPGYSPDLENSLSKVIEDNK